MFTFLQSIADMTKDQIAILAKHFHDDPYNAVRAHAAVLEILALDPEPDGGVVINGKVYNVDIEVQETLEHVGSTIQQLYDGLGLKGEERTPQAVIATVLNQRDRLLNLEREQPKGYEPEDMHSTLMDRLKAAVEGECDGYCLSDLQADNILAHILGPYSRIVRLMRSHGAATVTQLVAKMEHHIEHLQAKSHINYRADSPPPPRAG